MNHFLTLDETIVNKKPLQERNNYSERTASRAIVFDDTGAVALLHVTRDGYYKLPGGGIDPGESPEQALARELMEEIGCSAKVTDFLGTVLEQRFYTDLTQLSYCYIAKQHGKKGEPCFTETEKEAGFEIEWVRDIDTAIQLLESNPSHPINVHFMTLRDAAIARRAKDTLRISDNS